jgi:hypothetical protein
VTQDSGNISFGLQIGAERYLVKTAQRGCFWESRALFEVIVKACDPERSSRYDSVAEFCAAWRSARVG